MISRRRVLGVAGLALLAVPGPASAQPTKVRRIGYLSVSSEPNRQSEAFRDALRERGYVEGWNLVIEYRWANENFERLDALAVDLTRLPVEVIVAVSTPSALAAKRATRTIPIVFTNVADAVGSGIVPTLARPGGNITGLTSITGELSPKRLEILKEAFPDVTNVGALWHPGSHGERRDKELAEEASAAARALGVRLRFVDVRVPKDLDRAFTAMTSGRVGAVIVLTSPMFNIQRRRIAELAVKHRLPTIHSRPEFADDGGLMAYGPSGVDLHRRAAIYIDKILKGARPADLPIEQPTKFELAINLKTAKALGLTIPQSILLRADQVIQ